MPEEAPEQIGASETEQSYDITGSRRVSDFLFLCSMLAKRT